MTDYDRLKEALDENPTDWATRLVLADWYEDNDKPGLAEFQRLLAELRICPHEYKREWRWYCNERTIPAKKFEEGRPPFPFAYVGWLFDDIRELTPPDEPPFSYCCREAAEQALHVALIKQRSNRDPLEFLREIHANQWADDHKEEALAARLQKRRSDD